MKDQSHEIVSINKQLFVDKVFLKKMMIGLLLIKIQSKCEIKLSCILQQLLHSSRTSKFKCKMKVNIFELSMDLTKFETILIITLDLINKKSD